jgi:hypothetical protein
LLQLIEPNTRTPLTPRLRAKASNSARWDSISGCIGAVQPRSAAFLGPTWHGCFWFVATAQFSAAAQTVLTILASTVPGLGVEKNLDASLSTLLAPWPI